MDKETFNTGSGDGLPSGEYPSVDQAKLASWILNDLTNDGHISEASPEQKEDVASENRSAKTGGRDSDGNMGTESDHDLDQLRRNIEAFPFASELSGDQVNRIKAPAVSFGSHVEGLKTMSEASEGINTSEPLEAQRKPQTDAFRKYLHAVPFTDEIDADQMKSFLSNFDQESSPADEPFVAAAAQDDSKIIMPDAPETHNEQSPLHDGIKALRSDEYFRKLGGGFIFDIPVQYGVDKETDDHAAKKTRKDGHLGFDVNRYRRDFPILQRKVHGNKPLVWMDNGATTQKPQVVIDAISHYYAHYNSNIHRGAHELARESTDAFEDAREKVRKFIGAKTKDEIIFVRGTTEGINLIANSFAKGFIKEGDEIIISELEHHANIVPWQFVAKTYGARLVIARTDQNGDLMLDEYRQLFNNKTRIVSVSQASNAIGTVVPVHEMIQIAHSNDVPVVVDAAQSIQHMPTNVFEMDADFFVFSGHKIFAPMGVGVVYGKKDWLDKMPPWQGGGAMIKDVTFEHTVFNPAPTKFEAGTPNVEGPIGLGAALDYVSRIGMPNIEHYEQELTGYALEKMKSINGLHLIGQPRQRISVLPFVLDGIENDHIGKKLDEQGIAVRVGHHCAQPILRKFGYETVVRPSLAFYNTHQEVDFLVEVIKDIQKSSRSQSY